MADIAKLLEEIDALTVIELSELVKGIEEKYGVSAAAVAAPVAGAAAGAEAAEKSEFNVILKYFATIPMALLFILTTDPSEFAASLNKLGVSYKHSHLIFFLFYFI